jgi:predicted nucleotide-binding protein
MNAEKQSLPNLVVSKQEANQKIQERIDTGLQLASRPIFSEDQLAEARSEFNNWSKYNEALLSRLFDNSAVADEYTDFYGGSSSTIATLVDKIGYYKRDVTARIDRLKGILERLELIPEQPDDSPHVSSVESAATNNNEVFIVHGHDRAVKSEVARFVEKLGLEATILDEKPGGGRTIIEKFERYASNAGFAIVLLTPDDVGAPRDKQDDLKPRARQNVIFEIGYFFKGLGRGRVCAMSTEEVEFPSDLSGVSYVSLDSEGGWKVKLVREMEEAGLPVDHSKLV